LAANTPRPELLITTPEYHGRFYPTQLLTQIEQAKQSSAAITTKDGASEPALLPECACIAQRWRTVSIAQPLNHTASLELPGGSLVVGDNPLGRALAQQLAAVGPVH